MQDDITNKTDQSAPSILIGLIPAVTGYIGVPANGGTINGTALPLAYTWGRGGGAGGEGNGGGGGGGGAGGKWGRRRMSEGREMLGVNLGTMKIQ